MESLIDARLTALETALSTLIDSISSYNPSIPAAHALLKAYTDLHSSLHSLTKHQQNTQRIASLRNTITTQNSTITTQLTRLVSARTDLLAIPTSLPSSNRRNDVSHDDVLAYAKRIARFTLPPGMINRPTTANIKTENETTAAEGQDPAPAAVLEPKSLATLAEYEKQWLDPSTGTQFTPWPGEEVLKRGALGGLQVVLERGGGGEGGDGVDEEGEGDGGMDVDGEGDGEGGEGQALKKGRAREEQQQQREQRPKVFGGLDLYDPDEEA